MCIICNLTDPVSGVQHANDFLNAFNQANAQMKKAEAAMLAVVPYVGPTDAKRYKRIHKQMVRAHRAWNRLEHVREAR